MPGSSGRRTRRTLASLARDALWLLGWERRWKAGKPCIIVDVERAARIEAELRRLGEPEEP